MSGLVSAESFSCPLKPIESRSFTDMTLSDKDSHLHNFGERRPKVGVTSMSAMLPLLHCRADRSTRVKSRLRAPVTRVKSKLRQNRAQHPGLQALTTAPKALTPVLLQLSNFLRNFRFCFGNRIKAFPAVWKEKP